MSKNQSRRNFIKMTGLSLASGSLLGSITTLAKPLAKKFSLENNPGNEKLTIGLCSYCFRTYPLAEAIAMIKRLGVTKVSLKEAHLSLKASKEEIQKAYEEIKAAGLDLYTVGVIYMTNEEEVNRAFEYAKGLNVKMIVGVPEYDLLPLAEKKVKEYDIKLAIHNHGPKDKRYPSPQDVYDRIKNLDSRMGMCLDIGHTTRLGLDPSEQAEKYFDRLFDLHIKDETAAAAEGTTLEMGRGVIDIPKFFKTLIRLNYKGVCSLEYEKDPKDPLAGVAESIGYARGVLNAIS